MVVLLPRFETRCVDLGCFGRFASILWCKMAASSRGGEGRLSAPIAKRECTSEREMVKVRLWL